MFTKDLEREERKTENRGLSDALSSSLAFYLYKLQIGGFQNLAQLRN